MGISIHMILLSHWESYVFGKKIFCDISVRVLRIIENVEKCDF